MSGSWSCICDLSVHIHTAPLRRFSHIKPIPGGDDASEASSCIGQVTKSASTPLMLNSPLSCDRALVACILYRRNNLELPQLPFVSLAVWIDSPSHSAACRYCHCLGHYSPQRRTSTWIMQLVGPLRAYICRCKNPVVCILSGKSQGLMHGTRARNVLREAFYADASSWPQPIP